MRHSQYTANPLNPPYQGDFEDFAPVEIIGKCILISRAYCYWRLVTVKSHLKKPVKQTMQFHKKTALPHMDSDTPQAIRLIGQSTAIRRVRGLIRKIGPTDETVLLEGETGTGKDLVAQLIHQASARRGQSFVSVNCAALPDTLIENELFGHTKGAFTGASEARKGLFNKLKVEHSSWMRLGRYRWNFRRSYCGLLT